MAMGCQNPTGPARDSSSVQTDATVYTLRRYPNAWWATAIATYVNRTGGSVYYARCTGDDNGPMWALRRTGADSSRQLFTSFAWGCVGGLPMGEIKPGDSVSVRVILGSLDEPNMNPPLRRDEITGTMRSELELCAQYSKDSDSCEPVPQASRQSNAFVVRF